MTIKPLTIGETRPYYSLINLTKGNTMYINQSQAQTIFRLVATHSEELAHHEYATNFIATRQELLEIMEKLAPAVKDWDLEPSYHIDAAKQALATDREIIRTEILEAWGK